MKLKAIFFLLVLILLSTTFVLSGEASNKIAILKFASHPALDEFESSFINEILFLTKATGIVEIETHNANASPQMAKQLAEAITRSDVDLIITIATPAAQAVLKTPSNIPFLYGAVADPKGAGIIPSDRATGIQNAGPIIIEKAVKFIKTAFPELKKIGTLYNPGEQNSVYVQSLIKKSCENLNIELVQLPVTNPSQVSSMTQILAQSSDVIYSANDNTVNSAATTVASICAATKIPFILGDLSTINKGAFAAIGLEYKSMGIQLAKIAYEILNGKSVKSFAPLGPPEPEIWINDVVYKTIGKRISNDALKMVNKFI